MANEIRLFDLNIEEVLEHWSAADAIREVLANALDEKALTDTDYPQVYKDNRGVWHIRDFGRGLKYDHLTQNENQEKLSHPGLVIGKFGVGLKDAFAAFDRHNIQVSIISRHGNIQIIKASKHGFSDIETLHATITEPSDPELVGTDIAMDGVTDADVDTAQSYFLQLNGDQVLEATSYGSVIRRDASQKAKIYVSGLRVAEEENFLFSYNITSPNAALRKALNRERSNLGRSAYTERVKSILLACNSFSVAQALANDLKNFEQGTMHDELNWTDVALHASRVLNTSGNVIFLTPDQLRTGDSMVSHAQEDGKGVIVVPENIASRFGNLRDVAGNPMSDLDKYRDDWNDSFQFRYVDLASLTPQEQTVFSNKDHILNIVGSASKRVKAIKISETMRLNPFNNDVALGVWLPVEQAIVIRRDQLRTVEQFAGTLLHELVHATTGTDDRSIEFENGLTRLLGKLFGAMVDVSGNNTATAQGGVDNFVVGDRVCHPRFGLGQVVALRGSKDNAEVTVAFSGGGVRSFQAKHAQLSREET